MNIFRSKYRMIKEKLRAFGESIKSIAPEALYSVEFWRERLKSLHDKHSWDYIITVYLAYWCTDEERRFIDSVFFCGNAIVLTSAQLHLCERESYYWCDTIYKDLIGLAVEMGALVFDSLNVNAEIACSMNYEIDEDTWVAIEKTVASTTRYKAQRLRDEIEAMIIKCNSGMTWRELPRRYGSWKTIYNKYNQWRKSGLWEQIRNILRHVNE